MHFDFEAALMLATLVSGVIWAFDHWLLLPKRKQTIQAEEAGLSGKGLLHEAQRRESTIVEYARSFFPVLLVVFVLRSFLVEPFRIPSGSMTPTLLTGDFILVNKLAYGVRLPVLHTKVLGDGKPKRGDVTVFRFPKNPREDYIKRIVGLPGDVIHYYNKTLFVNGEPQLQKADGTFFGTGSSADFTGAYQRFEKLGEAEHQILVAGGRPDLPPGCNVLRDGPVTVPEGHYFALGDNRDASQDSRCWGFVPEQNLVGRAFFIWMHFDGRLDGWVAWSRLGNSVD